jgi:hypothetical protein
MAGRPNQRITTNKIQEDIKIAIQRGVEFLARVQQGDGGFISLSSSDADSFEGAVSYRTVFAAANILHCLNSVQYPSAQNVAKKTAAFLSVQRSTSWSYNYWPRDSRECKLVPYPDDLDDTFCALSALAGHKAASIDGRVLAAVSKLLIGTEVQPGGPYRTWVVDSAAPAAWLDTDLAVNANIAYFLRLQNVVLSNLTALLEAAIDTEAYVSPYYPSSYPIVYFISRAYAGSRSHVLIDHIVSLRHPDNSWGNPLATALSIIALLNLGYTDVEKGVRTLLHEQENGGWPAHGFCIDPTREGKTFFAGSAALTTAFCLEALARYRNIVCAQPVPIAKDIVNDETVYSTIHERVAQRLSGLSHEVRIPALAALDYIARIDTDKQIGLLPLWFNQALGVPGERITASQLLCMGAANVYGWMAYSIYDDFFDGVGKPELIPTANVGLREVSVIYAGLLGNTTPAFQYIATILDTLDAANAWEYVHCTARVEGDTCVMPHPLPDFGAYTQLADKSLGHALGPLAQLLLLGYGCDSSEVIGVKAFFTHYLIARQLNDDAHDWLADLRSGKINAVATRVLAKHGQAWAHLDTDRTSLQRIFWESVFPGVGELILFHVRAAREALGRVPILEHPEHILRILNAPEFAAKKALADRTKTKEFLAYF